MRHCTNLHTLQLHCRRVSKLSVGNNVRELKMTTNALDAIAVINSFFIDTSRDSIEINTSAGDTSKLTVRFESGGYLRFGCKIPMFRELRLHNVKLTTETMRMISSRSEHLQVLGLSNLNWTDEITDFVCSLPNIVQLDLLSVSGEVLLKPLAKLRFIRTNATIVATPSSSTMRLHFRRSDRTSINMYGTSSRTPNHVRCQCVHEHLSDTFCRWWAAPFSECRH